MDESLNLLEFDKVKKIYAKYCFSEGGKKRVLRSTPMFSPWEELSLIEEMIKALNFFDFPVQYHYDIGEILHKASMGSLIEPEEFLKIEEFLKGVSAFKNLGRKMDGGRLKSKLLLLREIPAHIHEIRRVIDENADIKDNASSELKSIRSRKKEVLKELKRLSEKLKERYREYLQDDLLIVRDGRYMLAVKSSFRPKIRGIVHHSSSSGATFFIEPEEIVPLNDERKLLEEKERREINRILRNLTNMVLGKISDYKFNMEVIFHVDSLYAKAMYAIKEDGSVIHPSKDGEIKIVQGRHPLIPKERVVPIDVHISREKVGLVITGPNMGGKTVTLKTIGLFTALAMAGFPVPASPETKLSIFTKILVDIGEEQDIELSLSTFSSHMKRIVKILNDADEDSLVLIDELGSGTDPVEGSALAMAILEELIAKGSKFVVTTHLTPVKLMAIEREEIESASVEFDPNTLSPTYNVLMGVPGASHAFEIAENLGLDRELVERARVHISRSGLEVESVIRKLQNEVKSLREEREKLKEERENLERERERYEKEFRKLKDKRIEEIDSELRDLTRQVDEAMKKLERAIHALKHKKSVSELRNIVKELKEEKSKLKNIKLPDSNEIKEGDYVRIKNGTAAGVVVEDYGDSVLVDFGRMKMKLKKVDLASATPPEKKEEEYKTTGVNTNVARLEKPEIDIRGMSVEEAERVIVDFVDKLLISGYEKGYIIHGKGTGRLAAGVWAILRNDPRVKNYRFGMKGEGGTGVTVVEV